MIVITVSQRADGTGVAEHGDHKVASRNGASMALARALIDQGTPDQPWEARGADGQLRYFGPSLWRLALLTCHEGDGSPRIAKWAPRVFAADAV